MIFCVALIPATPLTMWTYAKLAGAGRADAIARADRLLAATPPYGNALEIGSRSVGEHRAWGAGEGLVPVSGYTVGVFYRLSGGVPAKTIMGYYTSRLPSWQHSVEGATATFSRAGWRLVVDVGSFPRPSGRVREYAVYVSQYACADANG